MTELEKLKERFTKEVFGKNHHPLECGTLCQDLIRLCEAYEKVAITFLADVHLLRGCNSNCNRQQLLKEVEEQIQHEEAEKLYRNEK